MPVCRCQPTERRDTPTTHHHLHHGTHHHHHGGASPISLSRALSLSSLCLSRSPEVHQLTSGPGRSARAETHKSGTRPCLCCELVACVLRRDRHARSRTGSRCFCLCRLLASATNRGDLAFHCDRWAVVRAEDRLDCLSLSHTISSARLPSVSTTRILPTDIVSVSICNPQPAYHRLPPWGFPAPLTRPSHPPFSNHSRLSLPRKNPRQTKPPSPYPRSLSFCRSHSLLHPSPPRSASFFLLLLFLPCCLLSPSLLCSALSLLLPHLSSFSDPLLSSLSLAPALAESDNARRHRQRRRRLDTMTSCAPSSSRSGPSSHVPSPHRRHQHAAPPQPPADILVASASQPQPPPPSAAPADPSPPSSS